MARSTKLENKRRLKKLAEAKAGLKKQSYATKQEIRYKQEAQKSLYRPYADKPLSYFLSTPEEKKALRKPKPIVKSERQTSLCEKLIAEWLLKNGIRFKREKQFDDLINPITRQKLWIDFYLHKHKIVIEFDGKQHFKASKQFDRNGDSLEMRKYRDNVKNDYCCKKGLKMVRIKYNQINSISSILTELFSSISLPQAKGS